MFVRHLKKKRLLIIITSLVVAVVGVWGLLQTNWFVSAYDSELFVTTWKTNVDGATEPTKVTLNFQQASGTPYYLVSWKCDGNFVPIFDAKYTHDYSEAGTYDVCIKVPDRSSAFMAFYSPGLAADEKAKLQEIKQWGDIRWKSFHRAFQSMPNVQLTATAAPDLSAVTDMSSAFEQATNFTGHSSMDGWDTENVTNMSKIFKSARKFNAPIGGWSTKNVEDMSEMFSGASVFNQNLTDWSLGNVTTVRDMFYASRFNNGESAGASGKPLNWNVTKVENFYGMFRSNGSFNQPIGNWVTSSATNMERMFDRAHLFNQPLTNWDTSKVTTMKAMFQMAYAFNQSLSHFNTAKVSNMDSMFWSASKFNQDISS